MSPNTSKPMTFALHMLTLCAGSILVLQRFVGFVPLLRAGLNLIFRALQPCVAIYIFSEITEQLVHTCTRDSSAPSWRRLVFHSCSALMLISGFLRAKRPLAQTDFPFLLTLLALFVVAMLPPSAVILAGPLCSSPTFATSAERITRAFVFSLLYSIFVYAAAPPVQSPAEVMICTMRASAASIWVLAVSIWVLPLATVQAAIVIYTRIFGAEYRLDDYDDISPTAEGNPTIEHAVDLDLEEGSSHAPPPQNEAVGGSIGAVGVAASDLITPSFQPLGARGLIDIGNSSMCSMPSGGATGFGDVNVAAIAARLEAETTNQQ